MVVLTPATNVESAEEDFCNRYPRYRETQQLDELRAQDYARLDQAHHVYLD